jgi:hypothetical protein
MATDVQEFGPTTASGAYRTAKVGGRWYYHPTDRDWLAGNGNDEFSPDYATAEEALAAAEQWESANDAAD